MEGVIAVVSALMSGDNDQRRNAETYYNGQLVDNLMPTLESLIHILGNKSLDIVVRSMSGILLRRAIERNSSTLNADANKLMREALIQIWITENSTVLLKRLAHALAQSASGSPWPDLLPSIIGHANQNASKTILISTLNLVEVIAEYCPDDISSNLQLVGSFLASMIANNDNDVKVACARSVGACIVAIEEDASRNIFKPALQPIIAILGEALSRGDESDAVSIMESLVVVAQIQPVFFKEAIDNVVSAMLTVAGSVSLEFPTRSLAVELMVTFTETAPALARRCTGLAKELIPLCMTLALEVDDDHDEWIRGKYTEEPEDENNCVGEEAIERAAAGMGGRVVAQPLLPIVHQYATHSDWRYRRAAIAGLSRFAEGAAEQFKQYLPQTIETLSSALLDSSPRVKYEAMQAIGRYATLFPARIADLIEAFLAALIVLLGDASTCDKVRGHAASAMISLINPENCEAETLTTHLEPLLNSLVVCLKYAALEVQPQCLVLLGCAAQVAEEAFVPYYSSFMPGVKNILMTATSSDRSILRGKAMECVGLIGEAVGAEVFSNDALEVMHLLIGAMGQDDDITFDYILPACGRISKALQKHFEPFLPLVMIPLLAGATQEIQFSMVDADEDENEGEVTHDDETGTESAVISLGAGVKKRVTLNTHAVQQKNQAARMLYEFGSSLKGHLNTYLPASASALLEMVTDKHSADVRSSAILALGKIFEAYIHATKLGYFTVTDLNMMTSLCVNKLLESLKGDTNGTARACAAETMRDVLSACYCSGTENVDGSYSNFLCKVDESVALSITNDLLKRSKECLKRRKVKEAAFQKNEGLDAEDGEAFNGELEEEEELLTNLVDAMGQLLKLFSVSFMPVFESLIVPLFAPYLSPDQPTSLQIVSICLIDDAIEFGGEGALKYIPNALNAFIKGSKSDDLVLRQSSVYGIAQAARAAPQIIGPQLTVIMPLLVALVTDPTASEDDNEGATENGIFALGTILSNPMYRNYPWGGLVPEQVGSLWLKGLPLRADEKEAKLASYHLCDLVEKGDASVLGQQQCNLPELFRVFSEVVLSVTPNIVQGIDNASSYPLAHPETVQRIRALIKQLTSGRDPASLRSMYGHLSSIQQNVLC